MTIFLRWGGLLAAALGLSACGASQRVFFQANQKEMVDRKTINLLLWENRLGPNENISNTLISESDTASTHLIQIRGAEKPHFHRFHDSVVFMERGTGILYLGKDKLDLNPGGVVFIRHGTAHHFVNKGAEPAVAIAVFSPPYDGTDMVLLEKEAEKK